MEIILTISMVPTSLKSLWKAICTTDTKAAYLPMTQSKLTECLHWRKLNKLCDTKQGNDRK